MWLILLCAAALGGLAVGDLVRVEPWRLLVGGALALAGAGLTSKRPAWRLVALAIAVAAAGGVRAASVLPADSLGLEAYVGLPVRLRGVVVQPPSNGATATHLLADAYAVGSAGREPDPGAAASADHAGHVEPAQSAPSITAKSTVAPAEESSATAALSAATSATGAASVEAAGQMQLLAVSPDARSLHASSSPLAMTAAKHAAAVSPLTRSQPSSSPLDSSPPRARVHVVGDPAAFDAVATGETLVLEGRLVASDRPGPPTLLFPHLLDRGPPPGGGQSVPLGALRAAAQAAIADHLPEPQASLAAGVLLGGVGHLDADFRWRLQRSGLAHVVVIDGFKQVLVASMLGGVAVRLIGPRAAALPILLGTLGYTLLSGAQPAAVRAGLMVGLATLASLTGRVADPLTSVCVAATLMAAVDPPILLDVGLQLSLSATLGIVLLWPRWRSVFKRAPRLVAEPVGLTLAVTLATLPVVLSAFELVSLVSPLAHVLAVPLLPALLLSTALLALASPLPPLAAAAGWLAWLPSTVLVALTEYLGSLPGAALSTGRLPPLAAMLLAFALLGWGLWGLREADGLRAHLRSARAGAAFERLFSVRVFPRPAAALNRFGGQPTVSRSTSPLLFLGACLSAGLLLQLVRPDGRLHVHTLVQSRGEAVFVRGPTGRTALLVSGRVDGIALANLVADHLAVWEHQFDLLVLFDADAQSGLGPTLDHYPPAQRLDAAADARVDLGGGTILDLYESSDGRRSAAASVSFDQVWLPLVGRPPPAARPAGEQPDTEPDPRPDLVSDGIGIWAPSDG